MRTPLLGGGAADAAPVSDGRPPSDSPIDARKDGPRDVPRDLAPSPEAPSDRAPIRPDLPPDLPPWSYPDLLPDRPSDAPSERYPDLAFERVSVTETLGDLLPPVDRLPDRPIDRYPDLGSDRGLDRVPDGVVDLLPDRPVDRGPDRGSDGEVVDLLPDLAGDVGCNDGETVPCVCDNGLAGHRVCLPSHVLGECGCGTPELMRIRDGVLGTWTGTATTPWTLPYAVTFTFDSYSHYSAKSLEDGYTALYYGSDEDYPDKRYGITDVQDDGNARGFIDIVFAPGNSSREILEGIMLSADGQRLQFWFMYRASYGPLQYDLQRSTSPTPP